MKSSPLDLVLASDDAGVRGLAVTAYTAIRRSTMDIRLWIVQEGIGPAMQKRLSTLWKGAGRVSDIRFLPPPEVPKWWATKIHPLICFARVQLDILLPAEIQRCVYLDIDTLVGTDLAALYNTDLGNNIVGMVVNEGLGPDGQKYARSLGVEPAEYCNSGVMVIDMRRWRAESARAGLLEARRRMPVDLLCPDQDLLNVFFKKRITQLDRRWNLRDAAAPVEGAVIHFAGRPKPWDVQDFAGAPSAMKQWREALQSTGFNRQTAGFWPRVRRQSQSLRARVERLVRRKLAQHRS